MAAFISFTVMNLNVRYLANGFVVYNITGDNTAFSSTEGVLQIAYLASQKHTINILCSYKQEMFGIQNK